MGVKAHINAGLPRSLRRLVLQRGCGSAWLHAVQNSCWDSLEELEFEGLDDSDLNALSDEYALAKALEQVGRACCQIKPPACCLASGCLAEFAAQGLNTPHQRRAADVLACSHCAAFVH